MLTQLALVPGVVELGAEQPSEDDDVDALYNQVYRELLTFMLQDPRMIQQATLLLWAAHNLERVGDRVTNICERVILTETGYREEAFAEKNRRM